MSASDESPRARRRLSGLRIGALDARSAAGCGRLGLGLQALDGDFLDEPGVAGEAGIGARNRMPALVQRVRVWPRARARGK